MKESFKSGHLTPRKRRYVILRSAFLFYFKNKNDSTPAGVIPLEYYAIKKMHREGRGKFLVLRRAFKGFVTQRADAFIFALADKDDKLVDWFEALRQHCVNKHDKLFGVPLERVVINSAGDDNVPAFVSACVDYLSLPDNITSEGLFRLSGSASVVTELRDAFDQAEDVCGRYPSKLSLIYIAGEFERKSRH